MKKNMELEKIIKKYKSSFNPSSHQALINTGSCQSKLFPDFAKIHDDNEDGKALRGHKTSMIIIDCSWDSEKAKG